MCASDDPTMRLCISHVIHKAFVEVGEKGTEAAAAISVVMVGAITAVPVNVPFTPTFRADRPFVFAIRDTRTGSMPTGGFWTVCRTGDPDARADAELIEALDRTVSPRRPLPP